MVGGVIRSFYDFDVCVNWLGCLSPCPCVKSALADGPDNIGFGMPSSDGGWGCRLRYWLVGISRIPLLGCLLGDGWWSHGGSMVWFCLKCVIF